jgi:hypothetical protein
MAKLAAPFPANFSESRHATAVKTALSEAKRLFN